MKKLSFVLLPLLVTSFLISCGGGGGDKPDPKPTTYTISTETEGITISPTSYAPETAAADYLGNISILQSGYEGYKLPTELKSIYYVGSKTPVGDYKYKKNGDKEATLAIPKESFTDDIEFSLELVEPGTYTISTETEGITISPTSYTPETATDDYLGNISINSKLQGVYKLPDTLETIYYDGTETTVTGYTYSKANDNQATLEIPKASFNSSIKFSLDLIEPDTYTISPVKGLEEAGVVIYPSSYTPALAEKDYYTGTIEADPTDDKKLPENIKSVIRDDSNADITNLCTYTRDPNDEQTATLEIPKNQFTGDITFSLDLIDPTPDAYSIGTKTPGITIEPATFLPSSGNNYEGTITVNDGFVGGLLPNQLNLIWLDDDSETEITDDTYTPISSTKVGDGYTKATLVIPKESFTTDVKFDLTLIPTLKTPINFKCLSCDSDADATLTTTMIGSPKFSSYLGDDNYDFGVEYSWDCNTWETVNYEQLLFGDELYGKSFDLNTYDVIYFRWDMQTDAYIGFQPKITADTKNPFEKDGELAASGNAMSLAKKEEFNTLTTFVKGEYDFVQLFAENSNLVDASSLLFPIMKLTVGCYTDMFNKCTFLTQAPALPATSLADRCYDGMFNNCQSLTQAPALPATSLAEYCYDGMFSNCQSLTQAPYLPATTLVSSCYDGMFYNCTSLNYVKVGFGTSGSQSWPTAENATDSWLNGTAKTGTFIWNGDAKGPTTRSANTVPENWSVNPS